jgi:hypothetical protein
MSLDDDPRVQHPDKPGPPVYDLCCPECEDEFLFQGYREREQCGVCGYYVYVDPAKMIRVGKG